MPEITTYECGFCGIEIKKKPTMTNGKVIYEVGFFSEDDDIAQEYFCKKCIIKNVK